MWTGDKEVWAYMLNGPRRSPAKICARALWIGCNVPKLGACLRQSAVLWFKVCNRWRGYRNWRSSWFGSIIGAIAGGGKGAAIGAGVGAGAGGGAVLATRGKPAVIPSE